MYAETGPSLPIFFGLLRTLTRNGHLLSVS